MSQHLKVLADAGVVDATAAGRNVRYQLVPARLVDVSTQPVTYVEVHTPDLEHSGGTVVAEPYAIDGVGRACYITDPAGLLIGLHEYDASAP